MLHCGIGTSLWSEGASSPPSPPINEARRRMSFEIPKIETLVPPQIAHGHGRDVGGRAVAARPGAAIPDREDQHHRPCGHRHRSHGRHSSLRHRHHGHFRDRVGRGRETRDRADQRSGRGARPQDQVHPGRRRERLANLCRESQEAPRQRQGRVRHRLLDLSLAQSRAAGVRAVQRNAVLPDFL